MKVVRSVLAIIVGLMVFIGIAMLIQAISHRIYPPPEGIDMHDPVAVKTLMETLPLGAFLMVLLSWGMGTFVAGAVAALIAGRARCLHAGIIGGLVLAATIMIFWMIPHPDWLIVAGLLLPLPLSLLAGKLVSLRNA